MDNKKWYRSKTIWAGLVAVLLAGYAGVQSALAGQCEIEGSICLVLPVIPEWIFGILGALGIYGRAKASTGIE